MPISARICKNKLCADDPALANAIFCFKTAGKFPIPTPSAGFLIIDFALSFHIQMRP